MGLGCLSALRALDKRVFFVAVSSFPQGAFVLVRTDARLVHLLCLIFVSEHVTVRMQKDSSKHWSTSLLTEQHDRGKATLNTIGWKDARWSAIMSQKNTRKWLTFARVWVVEYILWRVKSE